jgi:hypothetical protein
VNEPEEFLGPVSSIPHGGALNDLMTLTSDPPRTIAAEVLDKPCTLLTTRIERIGGRLRYARPPKKKS